MNADQGNSKRNLAPIVIIAVVIAALGLLAGTFWGDAIKGWLGGSSNNSSLAQTTQPQHQYYTCGMHPWVVLPQPGNCPICHMELVPLDPAKFTGTVAIDPAMVQNIGVRLAEARLGEVRQTIRTVGNVDYNETAVRDVNSKVTGWVEKLYVDYTGKPVEQGQPLFELYSPELYSAQTDYLLALKSRGTGVDTAGRDVLGAVRNRLEYFDISAEQIEALEKSGKPTKTMTFRSPYSGLVIAKNVMEGQKIEAGSPIYRIADLSKVWVMVTLYEYQLPYVQVGQRAVMTLPYIPGQQFEGKVSYIYPFLTPEVRQAKVRLEFENPNHVLKPGMYANVELVSTLAKERVLVPREAVIDTGVRQIVFVSQGEGKFEPREVMLGVEAQDGQVEILQGIKAGEMVVTSGQFLLDSESRLRESLAKMIKPASTTQPAAPTSATQPAAPAATLPKESQEILVGIINNYLSISDTLASDSIDNIAWPAREISTGIDKLLETPVPGDEHFWHKHEQPAKIRAQALALVDDKNITDARQHFADLSIALIQFIKLTGVPADIGKDLFEMHCPMFREGQGGIIWMQADGPVRNPYFGKAMLGCFDKKITLPPTK